MCLALVSCGKTDATLDQALKAAKTDASASGGEIQSMATFLTSSNIVWADEKRVRYRADNGDIQTAPWETAALDRAAVERGRPFMAKHGVKALFVEGQRVNFLRGGAGTAPSGNSLGWIASIEDDPKCEIVTAIDLNRPGLQCERLSSGAYVYLQR